VPMFHPAAALHQPSLKTSVEHDFSRLPELMAMADNSAIVPEEKPAENDSKPTQLSLF
jgi:hypothetical protein